MLDLTHIDLPPLLTDTLRASDRGLALHYPLLWTLCLGLEAQRVLEVGAGHSTVVLLDALRYTGGSLVSLSTDLVAVSGEEAPRLRWTHLQGLSRDTLQRPEAQGPFEFVLHDGAHDAATVAADLEVLLPRVRPGGLVVVHDILHSYSGPEVRRGVRKALITVAGTRGSECRVGFCLLPYGFGLFLIAVRGTPWPPIATTWRKHGSPHTTEGTDAW